MPMLAIRGSFYPQSRSQAMWETISQIAIPPLSLGAIFLLSMKSKWGCVLGLCSQPFWFITSYNNSQWGVFTSSFFFTISWLLGIHVWFIKKPLTSELSPDDKVLLQANALVAPYKLRAEFLGDVKTVGVGGDQRTYTRVISLIGPHPSNEILAQLSVTIGNTLGINRITFEVARASESTSTDHL